MLVYSVSYSGTVSLLYSYGLSETEGVAPIDIQLGPNGSFYVLANKKNASSKVNTMLFRINSNGSLNWIREFIDEDGESVRAHEMLPAEEEYIRFSANYIEEDAAHTHPMFIGYQHDGTLSHSDEYISDGVAYVDGVASNGTHFYFAGKIVEGELTSGLILKINSNLTYNNHYVISDDVNLYYTDIILHADGFVATGIIEEGTEMVKNEGGDDILITHFDSEDNVQLHETVGSDADETLGRCIQHPLKPVLILCGHHEGYGTEESGNAYVAASIYQDVSVLMGASCKVPRVLFVDNLIPSPGRDNDIGEIVKEVLGNSSKETDLINFCLSNNINLISIYGLGYLFDEYDKATPGNTNFVQSIYDSRQTAIYELTNFINSCNAAGIRVGYIADENEHALDQILLYNLGHFNYSHSGKFNYLQLEHEFWNTTRTELRGGQGYSVLGINLHFTALYNQHIDILNDINTKKNNDGNVWQVFDYVAYFYNNVSGSTENYSNSTARKAKTKAIADLVDAVIVTYYQEYTTTNLGLDFLEPSNSTDYQLQRFRDRLSDFGDNSQHKIIPTFSAEYYDYDSSPPPFCGKGEDGGYYYDYLGKYLDGPDFNTNYLGQDFHSAEDEYFNQHDIIFSSPPTGFDNIGNVKITAFGWYRYSCVQDKTGFLTKSLHPCNAFSTSFGSTFVYIPVTAPEKLSQKEYEVKLYPNPVTNQLTINFENEISNHFIKVISITSEVLETKTIKGNIGFLEFSKFANGMYFLQVQSESGEFKTFKIIKQ